MTQQEIQERNKEIALMLGKKYQNNKIVIHYNNVCGVNPTGETWQECLYHSDWNWLTEAVEFIENLKDEHGSFLYFIDLRRDYCVIRTNDIMQDIVNLSSIHNNKILSTFNCVSDFAKLYNNKEL